MIFIQLILFLNFIFVSIIATTTNTTILQDQIDQLSDEDKNKIIQTLMSASKNDNLVNIDENWCCKINPGVQATSATRQIAYYVVKYGRHKCGYYGCGFLGWGSCTRWCSESWTVVEYRAETYIFYTQNVCPDTQLTCCAQHILVLGHCLSYTEIYNNQQILSQLNELGIVIPGPTIG